MATSDVSKEFTKISQDHAANFVIEGLPFTMHSYSEQQMRAVSIAHRHAKTWSDWVALSAIRLLRKSLDLITGYKHDNAVALNQKDPEAAVKTYTMTARKYLIRNIFLESVAGVPGMVSGMLRHLHSMRRMRRDNGWLVGIT